MDRDHLSSISSVILPARLDIDYIETGLQIRRLTHPAGNVSGKVLPFRSRGRNCRRLLVSGLEGQQIIIELGSYRDTYDLTVTGIVRAREANLSGSRLTLEDAYFRNTNSHPINSFRPIREQVHAHWADGIHYRQEKLNLDGTVKQQGFRPPQLGALHAIASHWTIADEPGLVVMPTGTGKTEVMIAAAIAAQASRLLVIVPTDALRQQTAEKILCYGLLRKFGLISEMPYPIVGILSSKPEARHFAALKICNVIVTTMSSIGLAKSDVQHRFASLFSHIFFDEAHHGEAATWKKFRTHCKPARVLLFTATPFREDGKSIDGKIIYDFPLSAAQQQSYFKPIRFVEVFEPDHTASDHAIAEKAVARLREDLAAGHNHILMARTFSIDAAKHLYNNIYQPLYNGLSPILIHSKTPRKDAVLSAIKAGKHKIIVCVDMFGEGFDLPNLKVAALHSVHKSLGITLQFIGRFARSADGVGNATFVANTADDGVPESLENLYREDANWNDLLADLSFDAINPQAQLSALVNNLAPADPEARTLDVSTLALRPKISAQVFKTSAFHPERFKKAFRASQIIHQPQISRRDNLLMLIVKQRETLDWTDSRSIAADTWDLYIAYYDPQKQFLYVHCSRKGNAASALAKAVAIDPQLISGETVFKTFAGLQRLILHSVGLTSRSRNVRYQMYAGLDVRNAIDPLLQQDKMKSNVTGVGYENGNRYTVGCSRKGKIWSMAAGSLAQWRTWCDRMGEKLSNANSQANDFLRFTLIPSVISLLPDSEALLVDWPDQLFESAHFRFEVVDGAKTYDFHDCELSLETWQGGSSQFRFILRAGADLEISLELQILPQDGADDDSSFQVRCFAGPIVMIRMGSITSDIVTFFNENPPLVRLADGSQLSGNILLKPREALPDTFDRHQIQILDWRGINFRNESQWRNGVVRTNSIQERFMRHLETSSATFIIDDDDTGESADLVAIEELEDTIAVYLWHCKYAHGDDPGRRAKDLYELCGQAEKSVKWTWSLDGLVKHLIIRESRHRRGRPTRFLRGSSQALVTLRKASRRKYVRFHIGIVQPGLSKNNVPAEHLAIIGAANSFIQTVTDNPLLVYGSH